MPLKIRFRTFQAWLMYVPKFYITPEPTKNHQIKPPTMSPSYPILFGHLNPVADQKEKRTSSLTSALPKGQAPHLSVEAAVPKP
jgi:hypothetical protein